MEKIGYYGKEEGDGLANAVSYIGPDIRVRTAKAELMLQYLRRSDSNPLFTDGVQDKKHKTDAYLGELIISPYGEGGRLFFALAYNQIKSCFQENNYKSITLNMSYLLRRNLKLISEYSHDLAGKNHRLLAGLIAGI